MFSQLFGRYLVDKSLLSEEDYKLIIEKQLSVRVKLGTIAVAEGLLTKEQVENINQLQKQHDQRFGDIAVEQGLLSNKEIEVLLSKQGNPYLQFVQLTTEITTLTDSQIEDQLVAFQKKNSFSEAEMEALKNDDIDSLIPMFIFSAKPHVTEIAGLMIRNFTRFISRDFYIGRAVRLKEFEYQYLACQRMVGNDTVTISLADVENGEAFTKIGSAFSQHEIKAIGDDAFDAMCEFINVTNGLYASEASKNDIHLDMEPPMAYKDQVAEGDFYVLPIYIEGYTVNMLISVNSEFVAGKIPVKISNFINQPKEEAADSKGRIVLVDDSKMQRNLLGEILTKAGYTIVGEAPNGAEAIEIYKKLSPDIITLDITMPEMDGLEALKHILDYDKDAKVIMITAAGQQDKLIEALKVGAKRFISKPFKEDEILSNIADVIAQ